MNTMTESDYLFEFEISRPTKLIEESVYDYIV
jgi:hypothetical protein